MKPMNPSGVSDTLLVLKSMYKVLVGNLGFGSPTSYDSFGNGTVFSPDNGNGSLVRVTFTAANTVQMVPHLLNRRPIGYIPVMINQAAIIYSGPNMVADTVNINLYASVAMTDTLLYIF